MNIDMPGRIRFGREICGDLDQAERREWWLSNGRGAYASGTVAGSLTRRYHGLLVAPVNPPLGRFLVFAKADATLIDDDRSWSLDTNRWAGGAVVPEGYVHLESFHLDGSMPVWSFAVGEHRIEKRIWMEPGADTTYVAYRMNSSLDRARPLRLSVRLLINARDHHSDTQPWNFNPVIERDANYLRVIHPNWFTLHLKTPTGTLNSDHTWIDNFDLPVERERGLSPIDQHLSVGEVVLDLEPGEWVGMVASLRADASPYLHEAMRRFQAHERGVLQRAIVQVPEMRAAPPWVHQLILSADSFIFSRALDDVPDGESVIAGYPWFGDWGRDTMIALPGLAMATGRYDSAGRILETFARFVDQGMLPNVFPGHGDVPEYNTVDAALWYIEAYRAYVEICGDQHALNRVYPVLESIIAAHCAGTRYGIGLDSSDGLLRAGEAGVQLTWMDAKVGDWVVTPRIGKPVEINALWFNALQSMAGLAEQLHRDGTTYRELAENARQGFQRFIRPGGGLYDVLDGPQGDDASVRPNQIFAVSLPYSPLPPAAQAAVVTECGRELLASYGLRSLSASDPSYRAHYGGGVLERDGAYHQGPLWTWLLGHYALAEYRVHGDPTRAQAHLEPIQDHLMDAALGSVSEIFDGAPPHKPRGAPVQAWSVACVLEAWWRLEKAKRAGSENAQSQSASGSPAVTSTIKTNRGKT